MAKKPTTSTRRAKPAASKPAAATTTEIPAASGAAAKPEGAAALEGGTTAKASNATGADAADPAGTVTATTAAATEETREQAGTASGDRKDAVEEGNQSEETARPPIAVDDLDGYALVVTGPEKGRRRAGFAFGREPTVLTPDDFMEGVDTARGYVERVLSVIEDPALRCLARLPDGGEREISAEEIADLRRQLSEDEDGMRAALAEQPA